MAEFTLAVKKREKAKKDLETSRKNGLIPAVMYGHGITPEILWVNYLEFSKTYAKAGESSIIELQLEGGKKANVLVHEVQLDPLSNRFSHIDFFQVRMNEKLEAHVPLEFVGEAPAVRELGGVLVHPLEEVVVKCLPADLPHSIEIDLSLLKTFDDQLKVKDLKVSDKVEILAEADTVVALVEAPRTQAELEALSEKVEADVTKVEGVVKETPAEAPAEEKK